MTDKIYVTRSSMPDYEEYCEEIKKIWDSHWLTNMGEEHRSFQRLLEEYQECSHVILYTNGHLALETISAAMCFPEGSEIITTPFTFASTTHAIVRNNLVPVFCDIREDNYTIDADEDLMDIKMIKLVLQPLIENAIYHGIKNKRGRGELKVSVHYSAGSKDFINFCVEDNGAGFTEERLGQVRNELRTGSVDSEKLSSVYGLYNVNKKLKLYYGDQTDGLIIESEAGKGSKISFTIPSNRS